MPSEKHLVNIGRIATVILMIVSSLIALSLTNALQLFEIILMFGAGTGLIFILTVVLVAYQCMDRDFSDDCIWSYFYFINIYKSRDMHFLRLEVVFPGYMKFPFVVFCSSIIWLVVTFLTAPENDKVLFAFYSKTQPGGPGWKKILNESR